MKKINDGLTNQQRYRKRHLKICRERTRKCQIQLNNKKRFGGLRFKVLKRDNYQCIECNKNIKDKNMAVVHHIDENKENNTMKNFITLCKSCHNRIHYSLEKYQFKKLHYLN